MLLEAVELVDAVEAVSATDWARAHLVKRSPFKAAVVKPAIRYTVWRYVTEALAPSPNLCEDCDDRAGDTFELEDPDDLLDMFEYGEWLDEDTFAVNIHPNCHCLVVRQEDVYW
jgi:hypothetical protein